MNLQVSNIRYFKTNRGVGYQAKTNLKGVEIANDGMGGCTYLLGKYKDIKPFENLTEWDLERILDVYEKSKGVIC